MPRKRGQLIGPIVVFFLVLGTIFMFLGLEMSSSYTRDSPDCSVWCLLKLKFLSFLDLSK